MGGVNFFQKHIQNPRWQHLERGKLKKCHSLGRRLVRHPTLSLLVHLQVQGVLTIPHEQNGGKRFLRKNTDDDPRLHIDENRTCLLMNASLSEADISEPTLLQLLRASGINRKRGKGKKEFLPHLYIIKNVKKGSVKPGEATWYQYFSGIFRMLDDRSLPEAWVPKIRKHLADITEMSESWEGGTVLK